MNPWLGLALLFVAAKTLGGGKRKRARRDRAVEFQDDYITGLESAGYGFGGLTRAAGEQMTPEEAALSGTGLGIYGAGANLAIRKATGQDLLGSARRRFWR